MPSRVPGAQFNGHVFVSLSISHLCRSVRPSLPDCYGPCIRVRGLAKSASFIVVIVIASFIPRNPVKASQRIVHIDN